MLEYRASNAWDRMPPQSQALFFLKFQISCPLDSIQFPLRIISFPLHFFFVPFHFLPISCISTNFLCFPSFLFHVLAILLDFLSISFSYPLFQVFSSFLSIPFISSWFLSISSVPSNFQSGLHSMLPHPHSSIIAVCRQNCFTLSNPSMVDAFPSACYKIHTNSSQNLFMFSISLSISVLSSFLFCMLLSNPFKSYYVSSISCALLPFFFKSFRFRSISLLLPSFPFNFLS